MFRFFESLVNPFPSGEPRTPPRGLLPFLLHYSKPVLPWLTVLALITALVSVVELVVLSYVGSIVDWLADTDREVLFAEHGRALIGMALLVVVGFPLLVLAQSLFTHQTIFGNYPMIARWLAHRYILGQSLNFFQDEFAGRVSQKVMQTALAIRETVLKIVDLFVYVLVYFLGALFLMGSADPWLMLPLGIWLGIYLAIGFIFVPRLRLISMAQADARAQMTGRIVDSYTNIQTIKLFAHTMREQEYARGAMTGFMDTVYRQMRLVTVLTVALQTSNALLLASVAGIGIFAWQQGAISLGAIAVAIALVLRIRSMSDWILWEVAGLFENIGTVQDGINTIAQPPTVKDKPDAKELVVSTGDIRFEQVRFGYGKEPPVVDGLDLHIRPGEKIGLVGRSGAGKSTLINLLLRFYDVEGGRVLIDGQNIAEVTQESLRRQISMVTQDTSLLHRSIRDNIRYGRPDAPEEEIVRAARRAHADEFIRELEDQKGRVGYDAHAGERGVKLSGGQRQRVAIARVILKDAPILILDEATSALDSEVEAAIQEQLYTLMEGKTVIAIAHRLSTIAMLDRLVVIDEGRVVESGTHAELLEQDGLYAALWQRQSGGFLGLEPQEAVG
ncbi:multidrug ABC transporter ATP-binding protein [Alkalilimnicola ehrlichii]|uniref:ABC transporter ATP-binding protein n=1 Tax=Alkalilimnicola ehrlichii TaxID=351052 RepID=UPI000E2FD793|nr:ABC transporter ATP-binding protein [Alkalilimnicola ehrlichii]RFA29149.1 multidrug ABC transporter ATP-binding protein [Alkalilimnicola ehrlichii]